MSIFKNYYYHGSIERYTALMGYLMQDLQVSSNGNIKRVPLHYAGGERRVSKIDTLPRAGLHVTDVAYNPQQTFNRFHNQHGDMNQRIAALIQYTYTLRAKSHHEALQALEQITGAFVPSLAVTVTDNEVLANKQSVEIDIEQWTLDDEWSGEGEEPQFYELTILFTLRGYLYRYGVVGQGGGPIIKEVVLELANDPEITDVEPWFSVTEPTSEGENNE